MKKYTSSPLPFQGQKRGFVRLFTEQIERIDDNTIVVDLFGGSGLLSHTVKYVNPNIRVIWNDYDNYQDRLDKIDETNELLDELRDLLVSQPRKGKLPDVVKDKIIDIVSSKSCIDWNSLSGNILFSMNYVNSIEELKKETLYNKVRKSEYSCDGYLDGVERVSMDYKDLYEQYKDDKDVLFLLDPPYLSTDVGSYTGEYWKLNDYLDVLNCVKDSSFFYFTSNKSNVLELVAWIRDQGYYDYFKGAIFESRQNGTTHNSQYTDIMVYRIVSHLKSV